MSRLPQVSGQDIVKLLIKLGYEQDRVRGSHIMMRQSALPHRRLTIPNHNPVAKGTLRAIIRQAGLSVDEFVALLK